MADPTHRSTFSAQTIQNKADPKQKPRLSAELLLSVSFGLAISLRGLALAVRILLLLPRLLATTLLPGLLAGVLVLLARIALLARVLILVRHRNLLGCT
jgi:uncharacterized protein YqhQ